MRPYFFFHSPHLLTAAAAASAMLLFSGCAQVSTAPHAAIITPAPDPNSFPWQNTTLTASGRAEEPAGRSSAQRAIAGQNAARVAALKDLKIRVRQLPVGTDQTVGSIMDNYINIRRAIEKQIQKAELVSQQQIETGEYEVQLQITLQPIADILNQNYITPTGELPKPPARGDEQGIPAVS
jgi:hypothetical protein